jgi:hypothetical protein
MLLVPLELVALVSVRFKKVSSPRFLLLFVWNLLPILTILLLGRHEGKGGNTKEMTSKR